jgi:hypothetical protein
MSNPCEGWRWRLYHLRRMLGGVDHQANLNKDKKKKRWSLWWGRWWYNIKVGLEKIRD